MFANKFNRGATPGYSTSICSAVAYEFSDLLIEVPSLKQCSEQSAGECIITCSWSVQLGSETYQVNVTCTEINVFGTMLKNIFTYWLTSK